MKARTVTLTPEEQAHLQAVARRPTSAKRDAFRAGVILRVAAGGTNEAIAAALKTRPATVSKWRGRFLGHRLDGLRDAARRKTRPLWRGDGTAHSGAVGSSGAARVCPLERQLAGEGAARHLCGSNLASAAQAWHLAAAPPQLVCQYRPLLRAEGRRHCRAVFASARERAGPGGG